MPSVTRGRLRSAASSIARREASTPPEGRRRRRSCGWGRTSYTACRRSTTSASPASMARGVPSSHRWLRSSSSAASSTSASRASAATPARTYICSRSRAPAGLLPELPRHTLRDLDAVAGHHPARARRRPHRHLLVTDGGFRPDGTFVSWPEHDTVRLTEAFRRAVLRLFVRLARTEEDRAFATRLARYGARNPVPGCGVRRNPRRCRLRAAPSGRSRVVGDRAVCSPDTRLSPIAFPIRAETVLAEAPYSGVRVLLSSIDARRRVHADRATLNQRPHSHARRSARRDRFADCPLHRDRCETRQATP